MSAQSPLQPMSSSETTAVSAPQAQQERRPSIVKRVSNFLRFGAHPYDEKDVSISPEGSPETRSRTVTDEPIVQFAATPDSPMADLSVTRDEQQDVLNGPPAGRYIYSTLQTC